MEETRIDPVSVRSGTEGKSVHIRNVRDGTCEMNDTRRYRREILAILEQDDATPGATLAGKLGITEGEVEEQIGRLADTRTKILVVDDEPDTLLPLTRALEADNYAVLGAVDGAEELRKVSNEAPEPDSPRSDAAETEWV